MATSQIIEKFPASNTLDFFSGFALGLALVCFAVGIVVVVSGEK